MVISVLFHYVIQCSTVAVWMWANCTADSSSFDTSQQYAKQTVLTDWSQAVQSLGTDSYLLQLVKMWGFSNGKLFFKITFFCDVMSCHVLWYRGTNIVEKTAACIFCSETADSWFPQNACCCPVDSMMSCVRYSDLLAKLTNCKAPLYKVQ